MNRETKKGVKAFIGRREKQCNKCGFSTYSLHVLYNHRYKCQGQLLGHSIVCCYCKRKFSFLTLYRTHKAICVKKILRRKFFKTKLKQKHLGPIIRKPPIPEFSVSCPICQKTFTSKQKFVSHLKNQNCSVQKKVVKQSLTARKSFINQNKSVTSNFYEDDEFNLSVSQLEKHYSVSAHKKNLRCLWCKSSYPSKKLFDMHLEMNYECAKAYYKATTFNSLKKVSLTARKTVSKNARKSFPYKTQKMRAIFNDRMSGGSARKSLPSSRDKTKAFNKSLLDANSKHLFQCPVCKREFSDMFTFFQHQKKMNHWGKATKSTTTTCKCPFCGKDFLHIKSRNAHVQNHTDISKDKIKAFFKNHTCNICSQTFVSELAKLQHMKIQHPSISSGITAEKYSAAAFNTPSDSGYASKNRMSSVPRSVKKKLKQQPNTCPVCCKAFSHTVLRNKHFNEAHLKIFECQFCNTKFKSTSSLSNHIELIHGKDFECQECKVMLKDELQLLQHVLKYHPNKDPKLLLPKLKNSPPKGHDQSKVKEIIKSNEVINNSFQFRNNAEYYCDVCDIGYIKLCGLQRHRQSKLHKDTLEKNLDAVQKSLYDLPPSPPPNPRVIKQPEILTCSECSEEFTNIKDFVPHRLSHFSVQGKYLKITELNPYMCEICSDVLDSHSKVQLHLFWHLQIESTANANTYHGSNKKDTIVPDRLSGQHVAKKSFNKQSNESLQEVVIGGVSKPLFTCEACNIGFTTKAHYSMHIRKLCKKIKPTNFQPGNNSTVSEIDSKKSVSRKMDSLHCKKCNCLFISTAKHEQHKPYCLKISFDINTEENVSNLNAIKFALAQDIAIAGCVTCGATFDSILNITGHLSIHQEDSDNSVTDDINEDILLCALCNCLLPLNAFKVHKDFCKIPLKIGDTVINSKHMNVLKSALELKCAVAGCIFCGVPFDDLDAFAKHLMLHQTNEIPKESNPKMCNGDGIFTGTTNIENINSSADNLSEILNKDVAYSSLDSGDQDEPSSDKSLDHSNDFVLQTSDTQKLSAEQEHDHTTSDIENLRKNFSQLLCLLISDPELMQTLGYGTLLVDDVLVNVLEQMETVPCTIKKLTPVEKFRKNIHTLLDLCLKDQIMEAIGTEKTTDEIVIEALKIFGSDVNIPDNELIL